MKNLHTYSFLYVLLILLSFSACKEDKLDLQVDPDPRGTLTESELVRSYSISQVDSIMDTFGDPLIANLIPQHGVELYKVKYETIDAKGEEYTVASGLMVRPTGVEEISGFAAYQHGTIVKREDVPSRLSQEHQIGILLAAQAGLAVSMTDYLGMGDSPGLHPYVHAKSEATAGIDMLRASQKLLSTLDQSFGDKLFIFGYSQGGHAAMAMHKEVQENHADEFTVTASAPMAGPYDISGYQAEIFMTDEPYDAPYYLPYVLLAYNDVYELYESPSDFLKEPFDVTIPALFDGYNSGGAINNAMGTNIANEIIRDDVLEAFKFNYDHPFRVALKQNDLYDWKPEAPMFICHCEGDNLVRYENALVAYNSFIDRGKVASEDDLKFANKGNLDHGGCVLPCLLDGLLWFDRFLQ